MKYRILFSLSCALLLYGSIVGLADTTSGGYTNVTTLNRISNTLTNTLTSIPNGFTTELWISGLTGTKVDTIPACSPALNTFYLVETDGQGNAAQNNIDVHVPSGTIGPSNGADYFITTNQASATFQCDGGAAAWRLVGTSAPGGANQNTVNTWTGANIQPPCPLTPAATILVSATACVAGSQYGVGFQTVTLNQTSILQFPPDLPLAGGQTITFRIKQPATGGPYTLALQPGYWCVGCANGTLPLSTAANAIDELTCHSVSDGGMQLDCPGFTTGISASSIVAVSSISLSNNTVLAGSPSGTSVGVLSVTMTPTSFPFTGTLSLSNNSGGCTSTTGANNASFKISGNTLQTNAAVAAGTYAVCVLAAQSGAASATQPFTINANVQQPALVASAGLIQCNATQNCANVVTLTSGHTLLVSSMICGDGSCSATNPGPAITSITASPNNIASCAQAIGAHGTVVGQSLEAWLCSVTGSGSTTVTVNYAASGNYVSTDLLDIANLAASPDDGKGAYASGTGTGASVSTNGATTQANEFVYSFADYLGNPATITGNQTIISISGSPGSQSLVDQYAVPTAAGVQTHTATASTSARWGMLIVALKHQ